MSIDVRLTGMPGSDVKQLVVAVNRALSALAAARYRPLGNPAFAIDTNFDVKNANAISYSNGGTLKTLAANANFDTGTTATIATAKWAVALLSISAADARVVTWATNGGAGYATEALAIAAMPTAAATETPCGYITVLAAGVTWTAGTDALAGGTGGTPATTTNYYNSMDPGGTVLASATAASISVNGVDVS